MTKCRTLMQYQITKAEGDRIVRLVEQLMEAVRGGAFESDHPLRRRPPRERIGPSPVYAEFERLMGVGHE